MTRRLLTGLTVVVTAAAGLVCASATSAAAEETSEVLETTVKADFARKVILRLPPVQLTAGHARYLYGYYAGTAQEGLLQGGQIRCTGGGATYESVNTTMDHPGASGGTRVVAVRWMFTPPTSGSYTCSMNAFASQRDFPDRVLTVVPGAHTRLSIGATDAEGGVEWRQPLGETPRVDVDDPATPAREDLAEVGPWVQTGEVTTFQNRERWFAPPGATRMTAWSGIEMSRVSNGGNSPFVAATTLSVTQLTASGTPCGATPGSDAKETTFDVHHIKIHHAVTVPVSRATGCTDTFAIKTTVRYVPGSGVKRHAGMVEDGVYTNTMAMALS